MKLKIVANNPSNYWCKKCEVPSGTLYKIDKKSYCPKCVPDEYKNILKVNQNREEIQ